MPETLTAPQAEDDVLSQGDYENELEDNSLAAQASTQNSGTPLPDVSQPKPAPVKGMMPPKWQDIQALPDYQQGTQQQRQNAFTTWMGAMNYFGEDNDYRPSPAEQATINEFGAKQARDLGMASFVDPFTGIVQPINTGQIVDGLTRLVKSAGAMSGQAIAGSSHGHVVYTALGLEDLGKGIEREANLTPTNPLDDGLVAKAAEFTGSMLPTLNPMGIPVLVGAMREQGLEDAKNAGLSPLRQEITGDVNAVTGAVLGKFAESIPWLKEADPSAALKQVLTQSSGKILLQSLAKNSARDAVAGFVQGVPEQISLGQNPISHENLSDDWDNALTLGIGGGLLGTGFKGLGIADAKGIVKEQWQDENDLRQSNGQAQLPYQEYVKARLDQMAKPPTTPQPPAPEVNPIDSINSKLESEINSTSTPESTANPDLMKATHPVFGDGEYRPQDLVGTMTTSDVEPGVQQLLWDGQATDRVRRLSTSDTGEPSWMYDLATPNELSNENFQRPTLTRDNLGQQTATETTMPEAGEKEVTDNGNEAIEGQSRPVLDQAELGESSSGGPAGERGGNGGGGGQRSAEGDDVPQAHGQEPPAPSHETDGRVNEGGGGTASAPPPTPEEAAILDRIGKVLGDKAPKNAIIVISRDEQHPAWVDPQKPGEIQVNPDILGKVLKDSDAGFGSAKQGDDYIRKLFAQKVGEEVIHTAQHGLREQTDHSKIYAETSPEERKRTVQTYGDDAIDPEKATDEYDREQRTVRFVEEHARQILQRKANGETTEDVWKQGAKPALVRYFQALYNQIKQHIANFGASKELSRYLKNIEGVLADAEKAGQDVPKRMTEAEIAAEEQSRQEQLSERKANNETLLDAVKAVGGLRTNDPVLQGELNSIKQEKNRGVMMNLFRAGGKPLDQLCEALAERGFNFETPSAMLDMIQHTLRTGKDVFPNSFEKSQFSFAANPPLQRRNEELRLSGEAIPRAQGNLGLYAEAQRQSTAPLLRRLAQQRSALLEGKAQGGSGTARGIERAPSPENWNEIARVEASKALTELPESSRKFLGQSVHGSLAEIAHLKPTQIDALRRSLPTPYPIKGDEAQKLVKGRVNLITDWDETMRNEHDANARRDFFNSANAEEVDLPKLEHLEPNLPIVDTTGEANEYFDLSPAEKELVAQPVKGNTNKLTEAQQSSEYPKTHSFNENGIHDLGEESRRKLDSVYGKDNWLAKPFDPQEAAGGAGVLFPERLRSTPESANGINPDRYMTQERIPLAADNPEARANGAVSLPGEKRVHIWCDHNGEAHVILGATVDKETKMVHALDTPDVLQAEEAARNAIMAYPIEERTGSFYAPDVIRDRDGNYRIVESNPTVIRGQVDELTGQEFGNTMMSGFMDYPAVQDAVLASLRGEEPRHVKIARDAIGGRIEEEGQSLFASTPNLKEIGASLKKDIYGVKKYDYWTKAKNVFSTDLQKAPQETRAVVDYVRKSVPDPVRREGLTNYLEAGGDQSVLRARADATKDKDLKAGYEAALNLTPDEKKIAYGIRRMYDNYRALGIKWGVNISHVENYVNHVWREGDEADQGIKTSGGRKLNTSFKYSRERKIPTYFEGEQIGLKPETKDVSSLLGAYVNDLNHAILSRKFIKTLSEGKASDGTPLVAPKVGGMVHLAPDADGKSPATLIYKGNVKDEYGHYRDTTIPQLANWTWKGQIDGKNVLARDNMAVHPEIADQLENIFKRSGIKNWWDSPSNSTLGRFGKGAVWLADQANVKGKTSLFGLVPSLFHPVQIMNEAVSHRTVPLSAEDYLHEPDLTDPATYDKAAHGLMLAPNVASKEQFMQGYNQSRDNLFLGLARKLAELRGYKSIESKVMDKIDQGVDASQKWIFETYIPALKSKFYDMVLDRNMQRFDKELKAGTVTSDDLKYLTARQANNAFGHLNYIDIARDPTVQHLMSFFLLAPDFFEARMRHTGQVASGLLGGKGGWEQSTALAAMGIGMFAVARLVNSWLNNGDTKPDQPFSIVYGNKSYMMRTQVGDLYRLIGVPWENGHFSYRPLFRNWRSWLSGRESPMARFVGEALGGVNYRGEPTTTADAIRDTLAGNFPITLQPLLGPALHKLPADWQNFIAPKTVTNSPISPFEQALGAMGIQVSRYSPINTTYQMASAWKDEHGQEFGIQPERGVYPTSDYTPLRYALDDGNYDRAAQIYQQLLDAHKGNAYKVTQGLRESLTKPFTGEGPAAEKAFVDSLSPADKATYESAEARRELLLQRFAQMRSQMQPVARQ